MESGWVVVSSRGSHFESVSIIEARAFKITSATGIFPANAASLSESLPVALRAVAETEGTPVLPTTVAIHCVRTWSIIVIVPCPHGRPRAVAGQSMRRACEQQQRKRGSMRLYSRVQEPLYCTMVSCCTRSE